MDTSKLTTLAVQNEMCLFLNCSHEKYCEIMYKYGVAYLHWYLPVDDEGRKILESSKVFWAWFRLQWEMLDRAMLDDADFFNYSIEERRRMYKHAHEPQAMACEIKPSKIVLAELKQLSNAL